jgi:hypothetical protein
MEHIIDPVYYQDFMLSGKPEFTLRSLKTGNEVVFTIRLGKSGDIYWVNNQLRQLLGSLRLMKEASENFWVFEAKTKDILLGQADQIKIFDWFWYNSLIDSYQSLTRIQLINHTGRCGHCHRELTHPESIPIGIGPDCFKKLGLTHKTFITLP